MTIDPATVEVVEQFAEVAAAALPKLAKLFAHLGSRDAVLVALDATLAAARAKDDVDLVNKPRP